MNAAPELSIVIPIYNECALLPQVSKRILAGAAQLTQTFGIAVELIWVDDASTDGSGDWLDAHLRLLPRCRVLRHERNHGKGGALRTGFAEVRGTWTLMHDADLEYDPADWLAVLGPLLAGEVDATFGSRFLDPANRRQFRPLYYWGNWGLTTIFNLLFGTRLTDMETGMKTFRTGRLRSVRLTGLRFEIEPEICARLARQGVTIREVAIGYRARSHAEGKKIRPVDGLAAVAMMVRCRLRR